MNNIIDSIIHLEWNFFDQVQNIGGRADCQDNFHTFSIMRQSQFMCWSAELLDSYYKDLTDYQQKNGNPITLKYAYMMKYTSPAEYAQIADSLPIVGQHTEILVDEITEIQTQWTEHFYASYPNLKKHARPIRSINDSVLGVSSETYLRCELYTYSDRTLSLYKDYLYQLKAENKNLAEMILQFTFISYGYNSIEEAENACS